MKLELLGEFGLIERIKKKVEREGDKIRLGIEDDAAAWEPTKGMVSLLTTDTLVENIHFDPSYATAYQIGWKSMAANLSDIAAMGGVPRIGVVSLCLPADTEVEWVEEMYDGMDELIRQFEGNIVGGDTCASPRDTIITISLTGEVESKRMATRRGAKPGDVICVTGDLGSSVAGLKALRKAMKSKNRAGESWIHVTKKHLMPVPRVRESRILVTEANITSMIDISDGLASEIHHICELSNTGAKIYIEELPIHYETVEAAKEFGGAPHQYVLYGGEDYELLFTISPKHVGETFEIIEGETGTSVSIIGAIAEPEQGIVLVDDDGRQEDIPYKGYNHFAKQMIPR